MFAGPQLHPTARRRG